MAEAPLMKVKFKTPEDGHEEEEVVPCVEVKEASAPPNKGCCESFSRKQIILASVIAIVVIILLIILFGLLYGFLGRKDSGSDADSQKLADIFITTTTPFSSTVTAPTTTTSATTTTTAATTTTTEPSGLKCYQCQTASATEAKNCNDTDNVCYGPACFTTVAHDEGSLITVVKGCAPKEKTNIVSGCTNVDYEQGVQHHHRDCHCNDGHFCNKHLPKNPNMQPNTGK